MGTGKKKKRTHTGMFSENIWMTLSHWEDTCKKFSYSSMESKPYCKVDVSCQLHTLLRTPTSYTVSRRVVGPQVVRMCWQREKPLPYRNQTLFV